MLLLPLPPQPTRCSGSLQFEIMDQGFLAEEEKTMPDMEVYILSDAFSSSSYVLSQNGV